MPNALFLSSFIFKPLLNLSVCLSVYPFQEFRRPSNYFRPSLYIQVVSIAMSSTTSNFNYISQPRIHERKSGFMKWLGKLFKGGSNCGGSISGRRNPQFTGDENMVWRIPIGTLDDRSRSRREKEELDHAIALSLAEDLKRRASIGHQWRTINDEELDRELQDGFNRPLFPPPLQRYPWGYKICGGCKHEIRDGNYLGCMGAYFHPQCFRCGSCGQPITENEFSTSGKDPYHKICFKELAHPKCEVCHQFIPTNRAGLIEYRCHPFWSQKYCPSHERDNTPRCCSCERLESYDAKYISLGDGRSLCLECMESAIMDTGDCQPLYHAIRDYYEGMNMKIDQQIPMLLVERQALNEALVGEKNGVHHMPETRGLCLSEESILKRLIFGGYQLKRLRTYRKKLPRRSEVTAILVLYGLPRLLTGAILAHELMHGWLRLIGCRDLNPEVEEGICQVMSYMWLESEVMSGFRNMPSRSTSTSTSSFSFSSSSSSSFSLKKGGNSSVENKLGEFFKHQIANDSSPAYGGGFRAANAAVNKYGLRHTLDHIRKTGYFPL